MSGVHFTPFKRSEGVSLLRDHWNKIKSFLCWQTHDERRYRFYPAGLRGDKLFSRTSFSILDNLKEPVEFLVHFSHEGINYFFKSKIYNEDDSSVIQISSIHKFHRMERRGSFRVLLPSNRNFYLNFKVEEPQEPELDSQNQNAKPHESSSQKSCEQTALYLEFMSLLRKQAGQSMSLDGQEIKVLLYDLSYTGCSFIASNSIIEYLKNLDTVTDVKLLGPQLELKINRIKFVYFRDFGSFANETNSRLVRVGVQFEFPGEQAQDLMNQFEYSLSSHLMRILSESTK